MKLKQLTFLVGVTLTMLFATSGKSQAAILQNATLATPPSGSFVLGECSNSGLCNPGDVLNLTYNTGSSSVYAKNDSNFNFTSFIYTILPNQSAVWNSASTFSFFGTQNISNNGQVLTFSNGVFPVGATALFSATTTDTTPVQVAVTFTGIRVPEPTNILGVLVGGALCLAGKKKLAVAK